MMTHLCQILTPAQAWAYTNHAPGYGVNSLKVSGFCLNYADVIDQNPAALVGLFGEKQPGAGADPVEYSPQDVFLLVFEVSVSARMHIKDAVVESMGGTLPDGRFALPFTGSGMRISDGGMAPEYLIDGSCPLTPGAQIRRVQSDGTHPTVSVLMPDEQGFLRWQDPRTALPAVLPTPRLVGDHELFIEVSSMMFPAFELPDQMVCVTATDSRAGWMSFPAYDFMTPTSSGVIAGYRPEHIDRAVFLRTLAVYEGKECVVEKVDMECQKADVLYLGAPQPRLASEGFVGDQAHGYRATVPLASLGDSLRLDADAINLGQRPREATPHGPFFAEESRRFHNTFYLVNNYTPIPVWKAPTPDGMQDWVIILPDARSRAVLAPAARDWWPMDDGRAVVRAREAFPEGFLGILSTILQTQDGDYFLDGVAQQSFVAFRILDGKLADEPELVAPDRVRERIEKMAAQGK